jgi:hypothetical protein
MRTSRRRTSRRRTSRRRNSRHSINKKRQSNRHRGGTRSKERNRNINCASFPSQKECKNNDDDCVWDGKNKICNTRKNKKAPRPNRKRKSSASKRSRSPKRSKPKSTKATMDTLKVERHTTKTTMNIEKIEKVFHKKDPKNEVNADPFGLLQTQTINWYNWVGDDGVKIDSNKITHDFLIKNRLFVQALLSNTTLNKIAKAISVGGGMLGQSNIQILWHTRNIFEKTYPINFDIYLSPRYCKCGMTIDYGYGPIEEGDSREYYAKWNNKEEGKKIMASLEKGFVDEFKEFTIKIGFEEMNPPRTVTGYKKISYLDDYCRLRLRLRLEK